MDHNSKQCLSITKAIVELIDPSGGSAIANKRSREGSRFEDIAMIF